MKTSTSINVLRWQGDAKNGHLLLLDQTLLPEVDKHIVCKSSEDVFEAIHSLRVRGAPAIGVAASYGLVLGVQSLADSSPIEFGIGLSKIASWLEGCRPTAVNLAWALKRMVAFNATFPGHTKANERLDLLLEEAKRIELEDQQMCRAIALHGNALVPSKAKILTHCNAGMLATAGIGTSLGVIYQAHQSGKTLTVFADETRPLLQGARLTAWELQKNGVPCVVICDNMAGMVMKSKGIDLVLVGADRIAANGDAANKIGTYSLAILARHHRVPFYVVAPSSTFDLSLEDGAGIPIEERNSEEITQGFGKRTVPEQVEVFNPAFDVTPADLITGIVTEKGIITPVTKENVRQMIDEKPSPSKK